MPAVRSDLKWDWQDEKHAVRKVRKYHRGRTRVVVCGPTGVDFPEVPYEPADPESVRIWRTYRRRLIRIYREQATEALRRLVRLNVSIRLRPQSDGLGSYFVADVDLGVDLHVRIKQ